MNKTYVTVIVLVLIIGGLFFTFSDNKVEAPISETPAPIPPTPTPVACTMDAKLCSDGSSVGRIGPNCEFAACPSAVSQPVKEFVISGKNLSFTPSSITVNKGDRVKITFRNTEGFHDFVVDEYGLATKQTNSPTTEVLEFVADKAGSFEYYCSVGTHRARGMKGTLVVQ